MLFATVSIYIKRIVEKSINDSFSILFYVLRRFQVGIFFSSHYKIFPQDKIRKMIFLLYAFFFSFYDFKEIFIKTKMCFYNSKSMFQSS